MNVFQNVWCMPVAPVPLEHSSYMRVRRVSQARRYLPIHPELHLSFFGSPPFLAVEAAQTPSVMYEVSTSSSIQRRATGTSLVSRLLGASTRFHAFAYVPIAKGLFRQ